MNRLPGIKRLYVVAYSIALVLLLTAGIMAADKKTRSVGFTDATPVISYEATETEALLKIMDRNIKFKFSSNGLFQLLQEAHKKSAPLGSDTFRALSDIIKKIVDRFLQAFDQ